MDAAKAIAGLLPGGASVMDFLEGVGRGKTYAGPALPLVLVPTTAGTGSEATKNAVLSRGGPDGFKKSFRDDRLMPRLALVDPDLLATCPRPVLAANAMDAFTQCLESYVSTRSNPLTDALALSGIEAVRDGLGPALEGAGEDAAEGRARLAYAALVSGICLAQTGLGAVHGLAAPLGAMFGVPHGVACGTLLAATTDVNIEALMERDPLGPALPRYGRVGAILGGQAPVCGGDGLESLAEILEDWTRRLEMPPLSAYGMSAADIPAVVAASGGNSMKTNPLVLTGDELTAILSRRL
jgi:alcohol dehydrogenase